MPLSAATRARQEGPCTTLGGLGARYSWSEAALVKPEVRRMTSPMRPPGGGAILGVCLQTPVTRRGAARGKPGRNGEHTWHCARRPSCGVSPCDMPRKPIVFWAKPLDPHRPLPYQTPSPCPGFVRGSAFVRKNSKNRGPTGPHTSATFGGLLHRRGRALPLANGRQKAWHSSRISRRRRASAGWC